MDRAKSELRGKLFVKRGKSHNSPTELLSSKKQHRPLVSENCNPRRESIRLTQDLLSFSESVIHRRPTSCTASVQPAYTTLQVGASSGFLMKELDSSSLAVMPEPWLHLYFSWLDLQPLTDRQIHSALASIVV